MEIIRLFDLQLFLKKKVTLIAKRDLKKIIWSTSNLTDISEKYR